MRRVGRIIYDGVVVISLPLFLATLGVWVRSYWVSDHVDWCNYPSDYSYFRLNVLESSRGGLQFRSQLRGGLLVGYREFGDFHHRQEEASKYPLYEPTRILGVGLQFRRYATLGFEWIPDAKIELGTHPRSFVREWSLTLPLYFLTLLFALLPAHYLLRVRRRRRMASRRAKGCCLFCGYDLRASAGRCPECGKVCEVSGAAGAKTGEQQI